jgi:putative PIN family toxin of toxin-antitoxin system
MRRAYLDTNLYISYLLKPNGESPPASIVRAGIAGFFTILFGDPTLRELLTKVAGKPYLASRIYQHDVDDFLELLHDSAAYVPHAPDVIPAVSRDRKDDYLLTYAILSHADYLVTGDKDLLILERIDDLLIVTPAEFLFLLEHDQA